jgi:hypothetical protein
MQNRRSFLAKTSAAIAVAGASALIPAAAAAPAKNMFIHHVYFWLKQPASKEDRAKLVEGLNKLSQVSTIKMFHIGQPADTNRDVIDRSYAISWMLVFKDKAAQESYQTDPIHLAFIKNYSHLWSKVVVYDSVDV